MNTLEILASLRGREQALCKSSTEPVMKRDYQANVEALSEAIEAVRNVQSGNNRKRLKTGKKKYVGKYTNARNCIHAEELIGNTRNPLTRLKPSCPAYKENKRELDDHVSSWVSRAYCQHECKAYKAAQERTQ